MGPSMSIDGVRPNGGTSSSSRRSFNGAVDEHRRSQAILREHKATAKDASMGPSMSIDGVILGIAGRHSDMFVLQWGRR